MEVSAGKRRKAGAVSSFRYRANRHEEPYVVIPAIKLALLFVIWACNARCITNWAGTFAAGEAARVHFGAPGSDESAD
jgi:hypothetical protein